METLFVFFHYPGYFVGVVKEHVFYRQLAVYNGLLGKKRHADALPNGDFAAIGRDFAGKDPEESRFTDTVVAHERKFFALRDAEGKVTEKPLIIKRLGDGLRGKVVQVF